MMQLNQEAETDSLLLLKLLFKNQPIETIEWNVSV